VYVEQVTYRSVEWTRTKIRGEHWPYWTILVHKRVAVLGNIYFLADVTDPTCIPVLLFGGYILAMRLSARAPFKTGSLILSQQIQSQVTSYSLASSFRLSLASRPKPPLIKAQLNEATEYQNKTSFSSP
jgi:hypothetical protein